MLLLTLTLLPTAPIAAPGPKPKEKAEVRFNGPDITSEWLIWDVGYTKLVIVYGDADLTFVNPEDFAGPQEGKGGVRINKRTGETEIIINFGKYETGPYKGWPRYQLDGSGEWSGVSIPYGTITASDGSFTIYEMFYERKGKGATGVEYVPVWDGLLSFTINIGEA